MSAYVTPGYAFTDGVVGDLSAAHLAALVAGLTINTGFITSQASASTPATGDKLLIYQATSGALRQMDYSAFASTLTAAAIAGGSVWVNKDPPSSSFEDNLHVWVQTNDPPDGLALVKIWSDGASAWKILRTVPLNAFAVYKTSLGNFDGSGVGQGTYLGWAKADGSGGRENPDATNLPSGYGWMQYLGA